MYIHATIYSHTGIRLLSNLSQGKGHTKRTELAQECDYKYNIVTEEVTPSLFNSI